MTSTAASDNGPEAQYREHLRAGRFMIQRSRSTGRYIFYPRVAMPETGETDLAWVAAAGTGIVHAITVNRGRDESYNVALVELDEGPRLMSRIDGVESVAIGTRVMARIVAEGDEPFVVFDVLKEPE